jgi:hypothetical protein
MDTVLAAPVATVGVSVFERTVRWLLGFLVWNEPNLLGSLMGVPQVQIINYERWLESGVQVV